VAKQQGPQSPDSRVRIPSPLPNTMKNMILKTTIELTYSQVMAIQSILTEHITCRSNNHPLVYIDVVNDQETMVVTLVRLFSEKMHDGPWTREP
jgi:hypothetical protein